MKMIQPHRSHVGPYQGLRGNSLFGDLERLFDWPLASHWDPASDAPKAWKPPVDLLEDPQAYRLLVELPGMELKDIHVQFQEDILIVSGERPVESEVEGVQLRHSERFTGKFERRIRVSEPVDREKITAKYVQGVLTVTLPKTEEVKPRQITIDTK